MHRPLFTTEASLYRNGNTTSFTENLDYTEVLSKSYFLQPQALVGAVRRLAGLCHLFTGGK
jgi:hypothetical protein